MQHIRSELDVFGVLVIDSNAIYQDPEFKGPGQGQGPSSPLIQFHGRLGNGIL